MHVLRSQREDYLWINVAKQPSVCLLSQAAAACPAEGMFKGIVDGFGGLDEDGLHRLTGMALLEEVCYWGWGELRLQMLKPAQVSHSSCCLTIQMQASQLPLQH